MESDRAVFMKPRRITFFGNFGTQNLGNECTLQAIIHNTLKRLPDAKVQCLSTVPEDTAARHNIAAFPSTAAWPDWVTACLKRYRSRRAKSQPLAGSLRSRSRGQPRPAGEKSSKRADSLEAGSESKARLAKWLRIMFIQMPKELLHWAKGPWMMKGSDVLIVPGTGLVSDYLTGPFGWTYDIFKWSIIARICRVKVLFVGIGVGPICHPLSKWFTRAAFRLADYRSYRDSASKEYMRGIGFRSNGDRVCPDLAFGLPSSMFPQRPLGIDQKPVIGVGLKDYYGPRGVGDRPDANAYHGYLKTIAGFIAWLRTHGYPVRVLIGDILYDTNVKRDFINLVNARGMGQAYGGVVSEPVMTVEQLLLQLAATDIVISPRFHNLVLALMLNKPVIALSDHQKLDSLMAGLGFEEYCVPLRNLDVDTLVKQLTKLERNAGKLKPCIKQKVEEYREALDQEYSEIFARE
jgi:polysaccharide pyruvyl transferase WcaK-like protein